jgi:poly-gamma-glutamate capsule biosynthesis protein CapA/YwtB (metallophosphatase superfamily)
MQGPTAPLRRRSRRNRLALVGFLAVVLTGGVAAGMALQSDSDATPPAASGGSPSPTTRPPTTPSPSPTPRRGRLLIHGTGDVSLDPNYIPNFQTYGYGYAWSGLDGLFKRDDLTVVNLECAISNLGSPVPKEFNFRCDPGAIPSMRKAGVEVANLGNNHGYDYGPSAIADSRKNLRQGGIAPVGAGKDQDQALQPAVFEINGWKVAVVGFDQVVDPYPEAIATENKPGTSAGHDVDLMVRSIRATAKDADIVIVTIHWGVELDTQPRPEQIDQAHRFIAAGADVIFGHHSHRLQPMGRYKGRPIFYGLGNFVWPNHSVEGATTAVAEVVVTPSGKFKGGLIPAFITSAGHPVLQGS